MPPLFSQGDQLYRDSGPLFPQHVPQHLRLMLLDANAPSRDYIVAQFNPTEFQRQISVNIGQLEPIGWSHPIRQYASTGAVRMPLKLWFSAFAAGTFKQSALAVEGSPGADPELSFFSKGGSITADSILSNGEGARLGSSYVRHCLLWLERHCYAEQPGLAPTPILLSWPKNLIVLATLDSMTTTIKMWTEELQVRVAEVDLQLTELRFGFRSSLKYKGPFGRIDSACRVTLTTGMTFGNFPDPSATYYVTK